MGKSGTALLPMLQNLDELRADAESLGTIIDERDANRADGLGDAFDRISKAIGGIGNRIISAVADPLATVLGMPWTGRMRPLPLIRATS